jgi:hypothetical protein
MRLWTLLNRRGNFKHKPNQRGLKKMKKVFIIMMALFLLISGRQHSYAMTHSECYDICDSNNKKCAEPVINLPEPRTPEEQQLLDKCDDDHAACQHSCEDTGQPEKDEPKQEDNK